VTAFHHEHGSWSFLPLPPQGRGRVSSVHWAHRGAGSARIIRAARFPGCTASVSRAHREGPAVVVKLRERSQPVAVETSW
jgi:hypothetical protein